MNTIDFSEFPEMIKKQWKQNLQFSLNGKEYSDLISSSREGIDTPPIFHLEEPLDLPFNSKPNTFKIGQSFFTNPSDELKEIAFEKGSDIIRLELSYDEAIKLSDESDLSNHIIDMDAGLNYKSNQENLRILSGPISQLESKGYFNQGFEWEAWKKEQKDNKNRWIKINSSLYAEAGANKNQQIAYILSQVSEYAQLLDYEDGYKFFIDISLDHHFFFEIAKIRALNQALKNLSQTLNFDFEYELYARASQRYFSALDYNNNILRSSTAQLAASLAGVNYQEISAYDDCFKKKNSFSQDLGRNQLLILLHELKLGDQDWVDGNYYVGFLFEQMGKKAIEILKSIEVGGGHIQQLIKGRIQSKITEQHKVEIESFEKGDQIVLGVNVFQPEKKNLESIIDKEIFDKYSESNQQQIQAIIPQRISLNIEKSILNN